MSGLNERMQERLDKWRKKTAEPPVQKTIPEKATRRGGKGDYGDVVSVEQWEEEARRSQTRR